MPEGLLFEPDSPGIAGEFIVTAPHGIGPARYVFKIRCNCRADLYPHFEAIYSTVYSGLLSMVLAYSLRSIVRYSSTVVPVFSLKIRLRLRGLMLTLAARDSMLFSRARLSIRKSCTSWICGLIWFR